MSADYLVRCHECGQRSSVPVRAAFVSGAVEDRKVAWICSSCFDIALAAVTEADAHELLRHGAHNIDDTSDWRPQHPESPPDGPALDLDALIDLDAWLRNDASLPDPSAGPGVDDQR